VEYSNARPLPSVCKIEWNKAKPAWSEGCGWNVEADRAFRKEYNDIEQIWLKDNNEERKRNC